MTTAEVAGNVAEAKSLIMPGAEWLALLLQHVPDKGEHLVRYYGW